MIEVLMEEKNEALIYYEKDNWSHGTWNTFLKKRNEVRPTPENIPLLLSDQVVPTYYLLRLK